MQGRALLEEIRQPPRSSFQVWRFANAGFTLHRDHISYPDDKTIGVWLLELDSTTTFNLGLYRDLRIYLSRLHAERECFKEIVRLVSRPAIRSALALQSEAFSAFCSFCGYAFCSVWGELCVLDVQTASSEGPAVSQ